MHILTDANFGAFADRDLEIFAYGWNNNFNLTDISTMKAKSLKRRKELVDKWFSIVGTGPENIQSLKVELICGERLNISRLFLRCLFKVFLRCYENCRPC